MKLVADSKVDGYLSYIDGELNDNSFGCGCCSYGDSVNGHEIETIDDYIKKYEASAALLKKARALILLNNGKV